MFIVINNLTMNHHDKITDLSKDARKITLVSPFIFDDFQPFFNQLDLTSLEEVHLITTLQPKGNNQLQKPPALLSFIKSCKHVAPGAGCQIHFNNRLHGKVYIFEYTPTNRKAIITSANLTHSGLNINDEWGILTDDEKIITQLENELFEKIEYKDVSHELIAGKMNLSADRFRQEHSQQRNFDVDVSLLNLLKNFAAPTNKKPQATLKEGNRIFLKPYGDKDNPIRLEDKKPFGAEKEIQFPNPQPKNIAPGDVLITFGTGCRSVLCIHKALTGTEEVSKNLQKTDESSRRWRWFLHAENLTPLYADEWWIHDINIDQLKDDYLNQNPNGIITKTGGKTYGAFNRGAGRLELDEAFGKYCCELIFAKEKKLS
ncbi:MAG: NgoFVII family restriction endonuclease [Alphaproteobacteria bacterium]|nr:NgoFVII family restriction endonuclease [Alphaproteobacteria bacterium]